MTFPILGANSAVGGYLIDNSLRFNDGDTPRLDKTFSTSNRKTWTWSCWVKRSTVSNANQRLISYFVSPNQTFIRIDSSDRFEFFAGGYKILSSAKLRDVSAWYHLQISTDTTQATDSDRMKMYINGVQITDFDTETYVPQNYDTFFNYGATQICGDDSASPNEVFDGYMAEVHFIDGQALSPTDFGEFDEDSGIWKPIRYSGSYGTNGFYLDFENSGSLGADQSGNGNDFTPTNLASTDQTTDTPTNNFATMNAVSQGTLATLSEGNLKYTNPSVNSGDLVRVSTQAFSTGKWYAEFYRVGGNLIVGIQKSDYDNSNKKLGEDAEGYGFFVDGRKTNNNTFTSYGSSYGVGDVVGIAYDADLGTLAFYVNGVSQGNAFTGLSGEFVFATGNNSTSATNGIFNFGQDSSFAGNKTRQNNSDGNGYGDFYYTPPSGYLALCTQNLATELSPTIDDGSQYFNTVLYTGNGSTNVITGVGFQPDFVWTKLRSQVGSHSLADLIRGGTAVLRSDLTVAEVTRANHIQSFDSDGFTLAADGTSNLNTSTNVAWNWLASNSSSSNTNGSITSTVSANTTAGFSIITYTGNGTSGATVGHGLGKVPSMVVTKARNDSPSHWRTYHIGLIDYTYAVTLNDTHAQTTGYGLNASPTSSVFELTNSSQRNQNTINYIAYCFAEIEGYSKFGKYTGNGSTDGTFVYTGFRPAFVIIKVISTTENWVIRDNKRDPYNNVYHQLLANASSAEDTTNDGRFSQDFLSNGFKIRASHATTNQSGQTYIYMAFAENPFVSSTGIPVTAR
jgi:hypothetical protein